MATTTSKLPHSYLERLLQSAVVYHVDTATESLNSAEQSLTLPDRLSSKGAAVRAFTRALRFEAHQALKNEIESHSDLDFILHAVNLNTDSPGIVSEHIPATDKLKIHTHFSISDKSKLQDTSESELRKIASSAEVVINKLEQQSDKKKKATKAKQEKQAQKQLEKYQKAANTAAKEAFRENAKKEIAAAPRGQKKAIKAKIADEKAELEALYKRQQEKKTAAKIAAKEEAAKLKAEKLKEKERRAAEKKAKQEAKAAQEPEKTDEDNEDDKNQMSVEEREALLNLTDKLEKKKIKEQTPEECDKNEVTVFESPVVFNRHISALTQADPHPDILQILLNGKTTTENKNNVVMFHGPPGTGKTYKLIVTLQQMLKEFKNTTKRFLVCAGSNVGTANLYSRAKSMDIYGSLIMKDTKIPQGTVENDEEKENWTPSDQVVFCTVSARSNYQLRKEAFDIVLLDEAAQIEEACVWGLLRSEVQQLYMSGDPDQLPATVSEEGKKHLHDRSLMQRLMNLGVEATLLDTQRRMHPDISNFSNEHFYNGRLKTNYKQPKNKAFKEFTPLEVIDVPTGIEETRNTSFINKAEAETVVQTVRQLHSKKIHNVVVIAPYTAQCTLLREYLSSEAIYTEVHTVDSFQGREADAVVLCTVRTGKSVGFWTDYRRLNVAMTRAKHILRIIGNVNTWKKSKSVLCKLVNV